MPDDTPRFALHDDLYALVVYLHASCNRDLWATLQDEHISISQAKLLDRLRGGKRPTIGQAGRLVGLTHSAAVRLVDDLAQRGYVRRETDVNDGRARRIILTPKGDEVIARLHAARLDQIVEFTGELDDDERADLRSSLRPVMARQEISRFRPVPVPA